jgi:hypothetical protein
MPAYCPVCKKYSDKYPTDALMEAHLVAVHPDSDEAKLIIERRRKGYAQTAELGKTTPAS